MEKKKQILRSHEKVLLMSDSCFHIWKMKLEDKGLTFQIFFVSRENPEEYLAD